MFVEKKPLALADTVVGPFDADHKLAAYNMSPALHVRAFELWRQGGSPPTIDSMTAASQMVVSHIGQRDKAVIYRAEHVKDYLSVMFRMINNPSYQRWMLSMDGDVPLYMVRGAAVAGGKFNYDFVIGDTVIETIALSGSGRFYVSASSIQISDAQVLNDAPVLYTLNLTGDYARFAGKYVVGIACDCTCATQGPWRYRQIYSPSANDLSTGTLYINKMGGADWDTFAVSASGLSVASLFDEGRVYYDKVLQKIYARQGSSLILMGEFKPVASSSEMSGFTGTGQLDSGTLATICKNYLGV